jgi:hypothetical protein
MVQLIRADCRFPAEADEIIVEFFASVLDRDGTYARAARAKNRCLNCLHLGDCR